LCLPCFPGRYENEDGNDQNCKPCGSDTYTDTSEQISCKSCPIGKSKFPGSSSCGDCTAGKKKINEECLICAAGYFQPDPGQNKCYDCPSGFFQPQNTSASCLPCIPGSYQNERGQLSCTECRKNYFTGATKQKNCKQCRSEEHTSELQSH
jgi:hypothetical protein